MNLPKIAAIALVALLVTAGPAVAMPSNAPAHAGADDHSQADDHRQDEHRPDEVRANDDVDADENATAENASEHADSDATDEDDTASNGDQSAAHAQGPPENLPKQVPDHVAEIHNLINQFQSGDFGGNLGHAISSIASDDTHGEPARTPAG